VSLVSLRVLLGSFGVARSLTGRNQLANRDFKPIDYPAPDGILSFDILTSVSRTGTNHAEDQPVHLHIDASKRASHVKTNVEEYAGLLGRVCPAAVYEYVDAEGDTKPDAVGKKLVINSQNCIHCKVRRRPFFGPRIYLCMKILSLTPCLLLSLARRTSPQTCSIKVMLNPPPAFAPSRVWNPN
jgi:ferredoxin-like protein FixX